MGHVMQHQRCAVRVTLFLALALVAHAVPTLTGQTHAARNRMTSVVFGIEEREFEMFAPEEARLDVVCGRGDARTEACVQDNLRPSRRRVSPFWAKPNAAEPLGYFVLRLTTAVEAPKRLTAAVDIEWTRRPGEYHEWIRDLGDWGYGYHLDGWGIQEGDGVRLIGPSPLRSAWVPRLSRNLLVEASSVTGAVVRLRGVRAAPAAGGRSRLLDGDFTLVEIRGDRVLFRTEIPSDMPCDGVVPPEPVPRPVVMSALVSAFFDADGTPRFDSAYGKGC